MKQFLDRVNKRVIKFIEPDQPGGLRIARTMLQPGGRVPLHSYQDSIEIIEVSVGERVLTVGDIRKVVWAGHTEVVPENTPVGILDPQDEARDGPFVYTSRIVPILPPVRCPQRIVAVEHTSQGAIEKVLYEDWTVRTIEEAVEDADAGLILGVHSVRPPRRKPYLRVHPDVAGVEPLGDLPVFRD